MSLLRTGLFATITLIVLLVGKKYYNIWFGVCDECRKADPRGLIKTDILWNKYICHACQEIYKVVILGQQIPEHSDGGPLIAQVRMPPGLDRKKSRWVAKWIKGTFFHKDGKKK